MKYKCIPYNTESILANYKKSTLAKFKGNEPKNTEKSVSHYQACVQ